MTEQKKTIVPQEVEEKMGAHVEAAKDTAKDVAKEVEKTAHEVADKAEDVTKDVVDATKEAAETVAEKVEDAVDTAKAKAKEITNSTAKVFRDERDEAAENLIRWGAARAGAIVVLPLLGSMALMANEVYMISRLAKVYDVKMSERTIMAFLGAFGAKVVGTIAATMIPVPGVALPVAVSVTYGIGRVAQSWIKDGLPLDVKPYIEQFEDLKKEGEAKVDELAAHVKKDEPLGDESVDFGGESCPFKKGVGKVASTADKAITELLLMLGVSQATIDDKKALAQGFYEVAKETGSELAGDIREKVKEAGADARLRAEVLRDRAQEHAAEAKEKAAELQEVAKEKAAELKEKAVEKAEEAKVRASELRTEVKAKAEEAKVRAEEIKEEVQAKATEIKEEAQAKAQEVKEEVKDKVDEAHQRAEELKK